MATKKKVVKKKAVRIKKAVTLTVMKTKNVTTTKRGKKQDSERTAMPAGFRMSKTGRTYTETRSNRSDK
jgi:hypothetical protein